MSSAKVPVQIVRAFQVASVGFQMTRNVDRSCSRWRFNSFQRDMTSDADQIGHIYNIESERLLPVVLHAHAAPPLSPSSLQVGPFRFPSACRDRRQLLLSSR